MLHSLEMHLHLFVLLFLSVIHVCFGWNCVSMLDIGGAVENAQWLLLLQKQQCLVLERTGFGIFCRNDMSKMQTFWRSQHPPPKKKGLEHRPYIWYLQCSSVTKWPLILLLQTIGISWDKFTDGKTKSFLAFWRSKNGRMKLIKPTILSWGYQVT